MSYGHLIYIALDSAYHGR